MKDKKFVLASILLFLGLIVLFVSLLLYTNTGGNNKTLMMTASAGTFVAIASAFWYCIMVVRNGKSDKKTVDKTHHFPSL